MHGRQLWWLVLFFGGHPCNGFLNGIGRPLWGGQATGHVGARSATLTDDSQDDDTRNHKSHVSPGFHSSSYFHSSPSSHDKSEYPSAVVQEARTAQHKTPRPSYRLQKESRQPGHVTISELAEMLDRDLYKSQWFVTGKVDPKYFCQDFTYEDADVYFDSLDQYVHDVKALFDQKVSRADIISTQVSQQQPNTIVCTWRLSGRANFGPWGMYIKPCIVYTHFTINQENGLIQHQEDRYSIRHWDLFLSAIFPSSAGRLTAAKAPPVPERIETPSNVKVLPVEAWTSRSGIRSYFEGEEEDMFEEEDFEDDDFERLYDEYLDDNRNADSFASWAPSSQLFSDFKSERSTETRLDEIDEEIESLNDSLNSLLWGENGELRRTESRNATSIGMAS